MGFYLLSSCSFLVLSVLLALSQAQCVFNSTHCDCKRTTAGGDCLSFNSGTGASMLCDVYSCGTGVVCDCDGIEMCEKIACPPRTAYKPNVALAGATGPVSCVEETSSTCINAPPLPSYQEACIADGAGGLCSPEHKCQCPDSTNTLGYCSPEITYTIHGVGDNEFRAYSCGNEIVGGRDWKKIYTSTITGSCSEIIVQSFNEGAGQQGIAIAIEYNGQVYNAGEHMPTTVASSPPAGWDSPRTYDYSSWETAEVNAELVNNSLHVGFQNMKNTYGAKPLARQGLYNFPVESVLIFRIMPPFCS